MKAIQTEYNGYKFRSRLEARWAVFFDMLKVRYQYEPEGFNLGNGGKYLPDFYLPEWCAYVEIKGQWPITKDENRILLTFAQEAAEDYKYLYVLHGDIPKSYEYVKNAMNFEHTYCTKIGSIYCDVDTTIFESRNKPTYYEPENHYEMQCKICGFNFLHIREVVKNIDDENRISTIISFECEEGCKYKQTMHNRKGNLYMDYIDASYTEGKFLSHLSGHCIATLDDALHAARTARFEHGEVPLSMQIPSIRNATLQNLQPKP